MNLSCLANNRKSFFVSFHSISCRCAENFMSFPLLSFISSCTSGSFISQTSVCLLVVFAQCLPLRMLEELLPFLPKSRRFTEQDQLCEEPPLEFPPAGCVRVSPQAEQSQIPVVHTSPANRSFLARYSTNPRPPLLPKACSSQKLHFVLILYR